MRKEKHNLDKPHYLKKICMLAKVLKLKCCWETDHNTK